MKFFPLILIATTAFFLLSPEALAHRVNVFAFVDGDEIQVECSFSKSQKVRNGRLVITDLETGNTVHEGVTNALGVYRFRPSDEFLATGHGLNIRLFAGEGHQDDWKVTPEELRALSGAGRTKPTSAVETKDAAPIRQAAEKADGKPMRTVDAAELEEIVGRVLDAKLSPINQALARQQKDGPELRDIVGGIGWILGLLGLAAYLKYRR